MIATANIVNPSRPNNASGFTLIELMVAMIIFAMLALAGWQIMDSVTKSRNRAKIHLDQLSQLDFAYLQLSQDLAQTINHVVVPSSLSINPNNSIQSQSAINPTFSLKDQEVSFIRFAAPDPRFKNSPILAKITYIIQDNKLIKQRFYAMNATNENPTTSVLLTDIKDAKWTALNPQSVASFPDEATLQKAQQNSMNNLAANAVPELASQTAGTTTNAIDLSPYQQLPRGIEISFTYHDEPITWRFSLPNTPPQSTTQSATQGQL